jgi:hypothetical protein
MMRGRSSVRIGEPMGIEAKLAAALAKYTTLCPLPAADVRAALEAITELSTALQALVDQIALTEPVDEEGHSFLLNDGYLEAVELLTTITAESPWLCSGAA